MTSQQYEENEKLLRVVLALDEYPAEHSEELAALDFKMNIVLELLADMLTQQLDLPTAVELRLGSSELIWEGGKQFPVIGEYIELSIYLHKTFPRPLLVRAQVTHLGENNCKVALDELPEGLQDMFDKFIFAHHRREVANSRHS